MAHQTEYDLVTAARLGGLTYGWTDVVSEWQDQRLTVRMTADAVRVGGVRGTVTAAEAQEVADLLGCLLPTPKLLDLRWQQAAIKTTPHPIPISSSDAAVLRHSRAIDTEAEKLGQGSLANVGKHWMLSERATPLRSVLYGWHVDAVGSWRGIKLHPSASLPGVGVIQPESTAHDYGHWDYSMTLVLCHQSAVLNGQRVLLADVMQTPELCNLVVHTGRPVGARLPC